MAMASEKSASVKRMDEGRKQGQEYEVLILALFLQRGNFLDYDFKIEFEKQKSAEKLDDVIFKYKEGTKYKCRYFQLKHRLNTSDKITADILLAKDEKPHKIKDDRFQDLKEPQRKQILKYYFNLQKYFKAFRQIKRKLKQDLNNELKDITVFTDVGLDYDDLKENKIIAENLSEPDNIVGPDFEGSKRIKLKVNERDHPLFKVLKATSDPLQLASNLAEHCMSPKVKPLSCDLSIFESYHIALFDENVLEKKGDIVRFTDDFANNEKHLSHAAQNLRNLFEKECLKLEKKYKNAEDLWKDLKKKQLTFRSNFGKNTSQTLLQHKLPEEEISDAEIEEFLDHLILAVHQPNVTQVLDLIIKPELKESLELIDPSVTAERFRDRVYCWRKEEESKVDGGEITGKQVKNFFERLKKDKHLSTANYLSKFLTEKLMNFQIEFKCLKDLEKVMGEDYQILHIKAPGKDVVLSLIKVYQYLRNKENGRFFFTRQDLIFKESVVTDIFKNHKDILVIECIEDSSETIDKLLDRLSEVLQENSKKKILLISPFHDGFTCKFTEMFPDKFRSVKVNFSFKALNEDSQKRIMDKKVSFQENKTRLEDIIELNEDNLEILEKALNWQTVLQLLQNKNELKIGETLPNLIESCPYYIPRILTQSKTINVEKLKQLKGFTDIFAISGCDKAKLKELLGKGANISNFNKFVRNFKKTKDKSTCAHMENTEKSSYCKKLSNFVLLSHKDDFRLFKYISKEYSERNVSFHWIELKTKKLLWKDSYGPLRTLRMCRDNEESDKETYDEIEFLRQLDRNVIVAAESGVGKSTLITSLTEKCKKTSDWIVRIDLNNFVDKMKKLSSEKKEISSVDDAISVLILSFLKLETSLEKEIFRYQCNQGKALMIFDGYDEINESNRKIVLQLIKKLQESEDIKLWILTRTHLKEELEDELSLLSYSLQQISQQSQIEFLKAYWNIFEKEKFAEEKLKFKIQNFAEKLVRLLNKSINDEHGKFLGIPLHTRMLAESFEDEINKFCFKENEKKEIEDFLPEKLDLLDLFERFVKKKFSIVKHEKGKIDRSSEASDSAFLIMERKLRKIHSKLAIKMLFPNEIKLVLGSKEGKILKQKYVKDLLMVGIIDKMDNNNNPHFIHRSFAEYFAVDFFYKHYTDDDVKKVIQDKVFSYENIVMRKFFDLMLAGDSVIHLSILNNGYALENVNTWDLTKVDKGGRTPLHLAAAVGLRKLLEDFLRKDSGINVKEADINMKDSLFGWRPLRYADKLHNWDCAEFLLQNKGNKEDLVEAIANLNNSFQKEIGFYSETISSFDRKLLHLTARSNFLNFTIVLIEAGANLNAQDFFDSTPLHHAAMKNNTEIMRNLIENNCDVNITDLRDCTALHLAVEQNHLEAVECLVENSKTDVKVKDFEDVPILFKTASHSDLRILEYLIKTEKFDISETDNEGSTLLHLAAAEDNIDLVKFLIEQNFDINATNRDGDTVLHIAVGAARKELLKYLLDEKKANAFVENKRKQTILYPAACHGDPEIMKYLVEHKDLKHILDIGIQDIDGNTAVHYAVAAGNLAVLQYLFQKKDVKDIKNYDGLSLLHKALPYRRKKPDILEMIIVFGHKKNIANLTRLVTLYESKLETLKFLIDEIHLDVNEEDYSGRNILYMVTVHGTLDVIQYLVEETTVNIKAKTCKGETVLHAAARNSDLPIIQYLIEKTTLDLNEKDYKGNLVIHHAAEEGNLAVLQYLIEEKNFKGNERNELGRTVLHCAAFSGVVEVVEYLEGKLADLNSKSDSGETVLHCAANRGSVDLLKYLLDNKNFNAEEKDSDGRTIFHFAAGNSNPDIIRHLVDETKLPGLNVKDNSDNTVVHYAAESGSVEVLQYLLETKGLSKEPNNLGETVLHMAVQNDKLEVIQYLIKKGFPINVKNNNGETILFNTSEMRMLKYLIDDVKMDISNIHEITNNQGQTLLHMAAFDRNPEVMKYLIQKTNLKDLNLKDNDGNTVLHNAAIIGNLLLLKYLLKEKNLNPDSRNNNGETILHLATVCSNPDIIKYLIEEKQLSDVNVEDNEGNTVIHWAALNKNLEVVSVVFSAKSINIKKRNSAGRTALLMAACNSNPEIFKYLEEKRKFKDLTVRCKEGNTVMHFAANCGNLELLKYLLEKKKLSTKNKNKFGETALHVAAKNTNVEVIKYLVEKGFDINEKDHKGNTILHIAAENSNLELVKYCVEDKKMKINAKNLQGDTVLDRAVIYRNPEISEYLKRVTTESRT